jgi:hypothetical protein
MRLVDRYALSILHHAHLAEAARAKASFGRAPARSDHKNVPRKPTRHGGQDLRSQSNSCAFSTVGLGRHGPQYALPVRVCAHTSSLEPATWEPRRYRSPCIDHWGTKELSWSCRSLADGSIRSFQQKERRTCGREMNQASLLENGVFHVFHVVLL